MPFLDNIGGGELFLIALLLMLLFGGKTIHNWAKDISEAGKEVRIVKKELEEGFESEITQEELMQEENKTIAETKKKHKKEVA